MDRRLFWPGALVQASDHLFQARAAVEGLGWLIRGAVGAGTVVDGLTVGANSPAALNVVVQPGAIYALENLDDGAYSSLLADTTHQVMKQGLLRDAATLACAAPGTTGQSINYLIQAAFQEVDGVPVILGYFNVDDPLQPWSGPNNAGNPDNTVRLARCVVQAKAGTAATTGTQTTPAPDAGFVGLAVVTVAQGQSSVTSGNISAYSAAPYIRNKLASLYSVTARGDANYTVLSTDRVLWLNAALTTTRTWTLPLAAAFGVGFLQIVDAVGGVSGTNTLVIQRSGSDTISGGASTSLSVPNGGLTLYCDGSNWALASVGAVAGGSSASSIGYLGLPQNIKNTSYTLVLADMGKGIYHSSASAHTITIPADASVDFPIGTIIIVYAAHGSGNLTIAITSDTLRWIPSDATGSRTLTGPGKAILEKVTATEWWISGINVT